MKSGKAAVATALVSSCLLIGNVRAWSPSSHLNAGKASHNVVSTSTGIRLHSRLNAKNSLEESSSSSELGSFFPDMGFDLDGKQKVKAGIGALGLSTLAYHPLVVEAADKVAPTVNTAKKFGPAKDALPAAMAAYFHYASIFIVIGAIMVERCTVRPYMPPEDEETLAYADLALGASGIGVLVSGYYRATMYERGWEFYANQPLFWAELSSIGVLAAFSLFSTVTIIKRSVALRNDPDSWQPMSERLASKMVSLLNAELGLLLIIPFLASTMSRGVGYMKDFPTEIVGPVVFGFITFGTCYKFVTDAFSWREDWEMNYYDDSNYNQNNNRFSNTNSYNNNNRSNNNNRYY